MCFQIHHDIFAPNPEGFYFRKIVYTKLEKLLMAFKHSPIG